MAEIIPYNQHFIHVAQLIGKPSDVAVFQYLWDKYCYNIRSGKAETVEYSQNEIANQRNINPKTMPRIMKRLSDIGLIKITGRQACTVNGRRYVALAALFYEAIKTGKAEDVQTALESLNEDALRNLGLDENVNVSNIISDLKGAPVEIQNSHAVFTDYAKNGEAVPKTDNHAENGTLGMPKTDNHAENGTLGMPNLESRLQKWILDHENADYPKVMLEEVRKCLDAIDQMILNVLEIADSTDSDHAENGIAACRFYQEACRKRHTENKYININKNNKNTCFNKLKQDNTVTSFSFLKEEEKEVTKKEKGLCGNSRFHNGLDDADENSQVESEEKRERERWQETDEDENFQSENQKAVNADNDDVDNGDDSDEEFHFQPLFGKLNTELRDFNKEYREELKRKRASQGEREHRRTPEEAERQRQEEMRRGAEVLKVYSSQLFKDRKSPDMREIEDMSIVIKRQQSQYPYFPSSEVKEFVGDMTCCLDRADKIYLNRVWDILSEYLVKDMYVDEEAGEKKPDRVDPEGGLVDADRLIPDILRPAYDETVEILERGTWTDKFGEEHPVTCGKEFQLEKIMLMIDWKREDGIDQAYYKISSKTIHDTYADKVPFIAPLFGGVKRGVMTEARRDCNFLRNLMRAGDDVNLRGKLTQIEYGIYLFMKKNCVFDKYYHFMFDESPKSVRRHKIVDIYNSLDAEEKEDFGYQDIFDALSDQREVMEPIVTVNSHMFSYRRVMQWNAMHEYESILDGEDHESEII